MGLEATCTARFDSKTSEGKALLEEALICQTDLHRNSIR
jgi:hypothetical protein